MKRTTDNKQRPLTIVVPAYNEEDGIQAFLKEIKKELAKQKDIEVELIVVNDGSTDKTAEKLEGISGVTVLHHKHNCGYGAALKTGIRASKFDLIAIIDSDNSYYCEDIFRLLPFIKQNDMVVGLRSGNVHKQMKLRRFAKWFLIKLAEYLLDVA